MRRHPELLRLLVVTLGRGAVVAGVAVAAVGVLGLREGTLARPWVWLAATAVVAATIAVSRVPLERVADRIAYGAGGDPYATLSRFVERISHAMAVDEVLPHVVRTVTQAMHSPRGEVRLWLADGEQWRQTWPVEGADQTGQVVEIPLHHHGEQVGELGVSTSDGDLSPEDRDLLSRLVGTAGLALANVRLTYDLRRRLMESTSLADLLKSSQQRLLEAAADQTRRFSATVDAQVLRPLSVVDRALAELAGGELRAVRAASTEAVAALQSLRELAAGVYPPALPDRGLLAALEAFSLRYDGRVTLVGGTVERMAPVVESAAYFCVVALVEDCPADGTAEVQVEQERDVLNVTVRASQLPSADTIQLLTDRVDATEGRLERVPSRAGEDVVIGWRIARLGPGPAATGEG